jgi:hypothetical protein
MKTNLIVVRAGDRSLHPGWIGKIEDRSWDLVVNYFGDDPDIYRDGTAQRIDSKGPKWLALKALFTEHPQLLDNYRYIWIPDDDLEIRPEDTDRFFDICNEMNLELSQPSLSADSPVTHALVLHNSMSRVRFTNFVEAMAPCFSSAMAKRVLDTFDATQSSWGVDWLWPAYVTDPQTGMGIVDAVVVRHTRPLGGPNYDSLKAAGLSPSDELHRFWAARDLGKDRIQINGVQFHDGRVRNVAGASLWFTRYLLGGFREALARAPCRWRLLRSLVGLARHPFKATSIQASRPSTAAHG